MELKSIYSLRSFEFTGNRIDAVVTFNKEHDVFKGHFPDNPIVPGVVQVHIIKELLEKALQQRFFLNETKSVKFLNVINPLEAGDVVFEIVFEKTGENNLKAKAVVKNDSTVFMKYSGNAMQGAH